MPRTAEGVLSASDYTSAIVVAAGGGSMTRHSSYAHSTVEGDNAARKRSRAARGEPLPPLARVAGGPIESFVHELRRVPAGLVVAVALVAAACGSATPTPASHARPSPALAGATWVEATLEQPDSLVDPFASASAPLDCSPCHGTATTLDGVAGGTVLVAVGLSFPPAQAAAWYSADGRTWQQASVPASDESLMTAAATRPGMLVAVGGVGGSAAAWHSADGKTWSQSAVSEPAIAGEARMLTVVTFGTEFVAAGDVEPTPSEPYAAFWTSRDGSTWTALPATLAGGRVEALAAQPSRLVAVGTVRLPDGSSSGAAWYSSDGQIWRAATGPPFAGADLRGVTAGGPGFVAVGTVENGAVAAVWTSTDGISWRRAPDGQGFQEAGGLRVIMTSVAAGPRNLVAVGMRDDAGNGSPTVWTSSDGVTWRRVSDDPSFGGGEMSAVVSDVRGFVAVGALGLPDNSIAAAWLSAPGG